MPSPFIDILLRNLNDYEKQSIQHDLSIQKHSEDSLLRKYIEELIDPDNSKKNISDTNRMLKSRAFDKITDILISDYHLHNAENFPAQDQILFRLKKEILLARILSKSLNQNRMGPFKTILNIIITESQKNEVYEVLIEALLLKKYIFALKTGANEFQKIDAQIAYFDLCQKKIYYAGDCYFKIVINNNLLKFKNDSSFLRYIQNTIRLLKKDYLKFKSSQINYYLHIILMFYYEKQKKYTLSAKYCEILFSIVQNNPVVYRKERLGFALINLSQYKTFTENYNEAARLAKESLKYYLKDSNNYIISKEQEFHIYFYHKKYEKAMDCINEMLGHKLIDSGNFTRSKYIYYQSAVLFLQKKHKQALSLLNKSLEIEKEKSGWNISLRIMNIMLHIELNNFDEASNLIESLRKFIERNSKKKEIKLRDILIVKLLRELEKAGFIYKRKNIVITKMLKDLSQKNKSVSWEHYSSELIPFHEWLSEKAQIKI